MRLGRFVYPLTCILLILSFHFISYLLILAPRYKSPLPWIVWRFSNQFQTGMNFYHIKFNHQLSRKYTPKRLNLGDKVYLARHSLVGKGVEHTDNFENARFIEQPLTSASVIQIFQFTFDQFSAPQDSRRHSFPGRM